MTRLPEPRFETIIDKQQLRPDAETNTIWMALTAVGISFVNVWSVCSHKMRRPLVGPEVSVAGGVGVAVFVALPVPAGRGVSVIVAVGSDTLTVGVGVTVGVAAGSDDPPPPPLWQASRTAIRTASTPRETCGARRRTETPAAPPPSDGYSR
jgi:hypothetical protein